MLVIDLVVLRQRGNKNNHFHRKISIQVGNKLTCKIPRKISQVLIFRSRDINFFVGSKVFRQPLLNNLSSQQAVQPYETFIHI